MSSLATLKPIGTVTFGLDEIASMTGDQNIAGTSAFRTVTVAVPTLGAGTVKLVLQTPSSAGNVVHVMLDLAAAAGRTFAVHDLTTLGAELFSVAGTSTRGVADLWFYSDGTNWFGNPANLVAVDTEPPAGAPENEVDLDLSAYSPTIHYRASEFKSVGIASGTAIDTWTDQAGTADNATQTGANRPVKQTHGAYNSLHFDGVNDYLNIATGIQPATGTLTINGTFDTVIDSWTGSLANGVVEVNGVLYEVTSLVADPQSANISSGLGNSFSGAWMLRKNYTALLVVKLAGGAVPPHVILGDKVHPAPQALGYGDQGGGNALYAVDKVTNVGFSLPQTLTTLCLVGVKVQDGIATFYKNGTVLSDQQNPAPDPPEPYGLGPVAFGRIGTYSGADAAFYDGDIFMVALWDSAIDPTAAIAAMMAHYGLT